MRHIPTTISQQLARLYDNRFNEKPPIQNLIENRFSPKKIWDGPPQKTF